MMCLLQGWSKRNTDHDVAIEVAQNFGKINVKSVFDEVWFRCRHATDDATSSTKLLLKTNALAAKGFKGIL